MALAHRWLPGIAAAALLSVAVATPTPPAAAARHSIAAISAGHPPGYKIVHAGPFNAPPSAFDSAGSATCPAGTVVWGGGVVFQGASANFTVNTSQPSGSSGWEARVNNAGATTVQFAVNAICANQPAGYKLVSRTVDNPPNTQSHATATCPAPKALLGGGTLSSADQVTGILTSAWPQSPAKFTGYMFNGTATDQTFTVLAICGHKPVGYKIAANSVPADPGALLSDGIACPAGTSALSGGAQDPAQVPVVQVAGSINQGTSGWVIQMNNDDGQLVHQVNGYVICAA